MHVIIPDDYTDAVRHLDCFSKLAAHKVTIFNDTVKDSTDLVRRFRDAGALVLIRERTAITEELVARLPNLKMISQTGKGTAHIDLDACTRHGVAVAAGTGSPFAPAELTWALILGAMRRIPQEVASLRAGRWQSALGTTVRGRTLGIWGYGKIGKIVAGYGRAFGMNVLVFGRQSSMSRAREDGLSVAANRRDLFEQSDVLSLHIRLTPDTHGLVRADDLAMMKQDAMIVNTSRAELIEPGALVGALRAGRPGFAAVDVYEEEPVIGGDHPLLQMSNVVCTPHIGYVERDSYELYFGQAFDNVLAFENGKPANVVNPDYAPRHR